MGVSMGIKRLKWGLLLSPIPLFLILLSTQLWPVDAIPLANFTLSGFPYLFYLLPAGGLLLIILESLKERSTASLLQEKRKPLVRIIASSIGIAGVAALFLRLLIELSSQGNAPSPALLYFGLAVLALAFFTRIAGSIAATAERKGRDWTSFFILSAFFPVVMWIVVSVMATDQTTRASGNKICPECAEPVKLEARLCKHCGSKLPVAS